MNKILGILAALATTILAAGCGNTGSRGGPAGTVCDNNMNPFPIEMGGTSHKITLEASELKDFPGDFVYDGSQIFYQNTATHEQFLVSDIKNGRTGLYAGGVNCVSGFSPSAKQFAVTLEGLTGMSVSADGKTSALKIRKYEVGFNGRKIVANFTDGDNKSYDAPGKVFDGKVTQYFFYQNAVKDTTNFQFRAKLVDGNDNLYLMIKFKRQAPPAAMP